MKVLHVTPTMSAEAGGPPVALRGLTTALAGFGVGCEVLTTAGGRFHRPPLPVPDVPVHACAASRLSSLWNSHSRELADFVDRRIAGFDIVHVHELWHHPGFVACRAARQHGVPCLVSLRGGLDPVALRQKAARKWLYMRLVQRRLLTSAAALHALTTVEAGHANALGVGTSVTVIPNGVDTDLEQAVDQLEITPFYERFPRLADRRVILFLGRLTANKGVDLLARSFVDIARRFDDAVLLIVGPNEGGTQARTTRLLEAAGVIDRVTFTGALDGDDKLAALACADVFVLPSYAEGFSNAVLEALAAGLPVVVSEHCNFPEVAERRAGLIVRNNVGEIGDAISALLADERRRKEAGRAGRRMVGERYSWSAVAGGFADLYRSILSLA
ncbi:MAG: glycosyltransferase [Gammaproteobacteria bacterium]|nr:glycosyltransferase [Gammaproteobacteria bacterium]